MLMALPFVGFSRLATHGLANFDLKRHARLSKILKYQFEGII